MRAGKEVDTTDFEIILAESQRSTVTVTADSFGQESTGEWHEGIFYDFCSLAGVRDIFSVGYIHSIGLHVLNLICEIPINTQGTKLRADYLTNGTKVKSGDYKNLIRFPATYYGATICRGKNLQALLKMSATFLTTELTARSLHFHT